MIRSAALVLVVGSLFAGASFATAPEAGTPKAKEDRSVDDLFDAPSKKSGPTLNDLKKASEGIQNNGGSSSLAPKSDSPSGDAGKVTITGAFAAEQIVLDKHGCTPGGREKKKVSEITINNLPGKIPPLQVCLSLASTASREMRLSTSIVDTRGLRSGKAETIVDFRGKPKLDTILEFPSMPMKTAGTYSYVVELDSEELGRMPLFIVKVEQ
jgi:hypothetical protein